MIISAIVATAKNNVIGKDNGIPWYLSEDLKYFKRTTLNHHIIMGRNSYESIGRPLPKRTNIIVTRNLYYTVSNCIIVHSIEDGLQIAKDNNEEEVFIIGGAQIYEQSIDFLDRIYLTQVDLEVEGDTYFPTLNPADWKIISSDPHKANEKNPHDYTFLVYERQSTGEEE